MNPTLLIVAGANGSGKTTLMKNYKSLISDIPFINPDDIAKEIDNSYDGKDNKLIIKASKIALKKQNKMLQKRYSFGLETTLSGVREIKLMKLAKEFGYDIRFVYIGIDNPIINLERVMQRYKNGGHYVDSKTLLRRYKRSMQNLFIGIKLSNKSYIFDNSTKKHFLIYKIESNKITKKSKQSIPNWAKKIEGEL